MFRKALAAVAAAAGILGIIGAAAGTASAAARHSDYYVHTLDGQWVAEDQLSAAQIGALDNEPDCAPIQTAVLVDQVLTVRPGGNPDVVLGVIDGRDLISVDDATGSQLSAANLDQVGLAGIPTFLGPTGYKVVGYMLDATGHVYPLTVC